MLLLVFTLVEVTAVLLFTVLVPVLTLFMVLVDVLVLLVLTNVAESYELGVGGFCAVCDVAKHGYSNPTKIATLVSVGLIFAPCCYFYMSRLTTTI